MGHRRNHEISQSDEHYTPKSLFDAMALTFDLDVAAPEFGVPWLPAKNHYSLQNDGLENDWYGRVWLNPPYSKPTPWVDKFIDHGNGVALLVVSKSKWFHKLWEAAHGICPTPRELKFERPDGHRRQIAFQTFLFAIGEENVQGLKRLSEKTR